MEKSLLNTGDGPTSPPSRARRPRPVLPLKDLDDRVSYLHSRSLKISPRNGYETGARDYIAFCFYLLIQLHKRFLVTSHTRHNSLPQVPNILLGLDTSSITSTPILIRTEHLPLYKQPSQALKSPRRSCSSKASTSHCTPPCLSSFLFEKSFL